MADPNPHAIDALLDAINTGKGDLARDLATAIARAAAPLRCPDCGSMQFFVEQLTWNRQAYDAADPEGDCWGSTDHGGEYEDYPLRAVCQECERDCTLLLAAANVSTFYCDPELDTVRNNPAPAGLVKRPGVEAGCGTPTCRDCYAPAGLTPAQAAGFTREG